MARGIRLRVWGDYALFSRPEFKVERCTYDIITPSAARGILEAIFWHPGLRWVIDKIHVVKPIAFTTIRRNEVKSKASGANAMSVMNGAKKELYINTKDDIAQRASVILTDVEYVIEAHFEMTDKASPTDNEGKFLDITNRRIRKGQFYHQPYFGTREFPVRFAPCEEEKIVTAYDQEYEKDLGFMLYDMDYSDRENIQPMFFRATMKRGVVDLRDCEVLR